VLIVNVNGVNLIKFKIIIIKSKLIKIISLDFFELTKIGLISFLIAIINELKIIKNLFFFENTISNKGEKSINQFIFIIDEEGSNIENMFIIIFKNLWLQLILIFYL
jgi:hypothetical protein